MEAAGAQAAASVSSKGHAGHACLPTERLGVWVQLPPHSRLCERGSGTPGAEAVPHAPPGASCQGHRTTESRWHRGSIPTPHPHQPGPGGPRQTEPVVCQPRGQQQHAKPESQLCAADPLPPRTHLPSNHAPVPAARMPRSRGRPGDQPHAGVTVPQYDGACLRGWNGPNINNMKWSQEANEKVETKIDTSLQRTSVQLTGAQHKCIRFRKQQRKMVTTKRQN